MSATGTGGVAGGEMMPEMEDLLPEMDDDLDMGDGMDDMDMGDDELGGDELGMDDDLGGDEMGLEGEGEAEMVEVDRAELESILSQVASGELDPQAAMDQCCGGDDLGGMDDLVGDVDGGDDLGDMGDDMGGDDMGDEFGDVDDISECYPMESRISDIAKMITEDPDIILSRRRRSGRGQRRK